MHLDLSAVPSGYPIPDPNPKFFPIPNPYPKSFQNLRVFRVSGISENKAFSPNSSVITFLAIRTSTSIILISNQLDCKGQSNKAAQTSAPHRLQCSEVPSLPQSQYWQNLWILTIAGFHTKNKTMGPDVWDKPLITWDTMSVFFSNQYKLFEVFCQNHTCVFFPNI